MATAKTEQTITLNKALEFIDNSNGKIFAIKFVKRTTGEIREMTCRTDVSSYLKGGEANYDRDEKRLILVFDMEKLDYRAIPWEGITSIKIKGEWFEVINPRKKAQK